MLNKTLYPRFFRKIVFPAAEFFQKTDIQKKLARLTKTQWLTHEEILRLQNEKLRALIHHAYANVPYYHAVFKELGLRPEDIKSKKDLEKIPFLTKEIIRRHSEELRAKNVPLSMTLPAHSSGTTGEPLKFLISRSAYSMGWAQTFRCWEWGGYRFGDPYVKISPERRNGWRKNLQDRMMNTKFISALDLNRQSISQKIRETVAFNPVIIRSYASPMYFMAKFADPKDLDGFSPAAITTTGEKLLPHYRQCIESTFHCQVLDAYGGESTPLAFECDHHQGYHLCEESSIVEILKNDMPAGCGEMGEIAFTNLDNYAMPFIRYKVGDLGTLSDEFCSCGRGLAMMKAIEGRSSDLIIAPNKNALTVNFFTDLFKDIAGIDQFQVIQDTLENITVKIVKSQDFSISSCSTILAEMRKYGGEDMKITFEYPESIPMTTSGKRRFIISKVPLDALWK